MKDNFHSDEILKKYGYSETIWDNYKKRYNYHIKMDFENKETKKIEKGVQEVKSNENEQIYIILSFPYTFTFLSRSE